MSTKQEGFLADPKVWLALAALVLSLLNFVWMLVNQTEQNRRWNAVNAGSIELTKTTFTVFMEMTDAEYKSYVSDYAIRVYGEPSAPGKVVFINCLRLRNARTGAVVEDINPTYNIAGVNAELKKIKYKEPVKVTKLFRPTFYFKNVGNTDVTDFTSRVEVQAGTKWYVIQSAGTPIRIAKGEEVNAVIDFEQSPQTQPPATIRFRVMIDYTDVNGDRKSRQVPVTWNLVNNTWNRE